jgi:hypothetical protein
MTPVARFTAVASVRMRGEKNFLQTASAAADAT